MTKPPGSLLVLLALFAVSCGGEGVRAPVGDDANDLENETGAADTTDVGGTDDDLGDTADSGASDVDETSPNDVVEDAEDAREREPDIGDASDALDDIDDADDVASDTPDVNDVDDEPDTPEDTDIATDSGDDETTPDGGVDADSGDADSGDADSGDADAEAGFDAAADAETGTDADAAVDGDAGTDADATTDVGTPPAGDWGRLPTAPTCASLSGQSGWTDWSYVGCEFWSADLPVFDGSFGASTRPEDPYGVRIRNVSATEATVTFEGWTGGPPIPTPVTVPPDGVVSVVLGKVDMDGTGTAARAFRITSDRPVVVQQQNPLDVGGADSVGATLLLPTRMLGTRYSAIATPGDEASAVFVHDGMDAFIVVVATAVGTTQVTVTPSVNVVPGIGIPVWGAGEQRTIALERGQVLSLTFNLSAGTATDPSGTVITATQPVSVFSGHEWAAVGESTDAGPPAWDDRFEEQLLPLTRWGSRYVCARSPRRGTEPDLWIVTAGTSPATITTTPAVPGLNGVSLTPGSALSVLASDSFVLEATASVQVARVTVGGYAVGVDRHVGDPSMVVLRPTLGFSEGAAPIVPPDHSETWLTITSPRGAFVFLNGEHLTTTPEIVADQWDVRQVEVTSGGHLVRSQDPISVTMTAYGADHAISTQSASVD